MISLFLLLEQTPFGRQRLVPARRVPTRPLPSAYYRKKIKSMNPDDLEDDAVRRKKIHRQHAVKAKDPSTLGFRPTVGQQLTKEAAKP